MMMSLFRGAVLGSIIAAASAGTPDNVSSRLEIHVRRLSCSSDFSAFSLVNVQGFYVPLYYDSPFFFNLGLSIDLPCRWALSLCYRLALYLAFMRC
jgi:hypothetical protein